MEVAETKLAQLLSGSQLQFQIPLYQRTYDWDDGNLRRLWKDILDQAALALAGETKSTHFLGSLVMAEHPASQPTFYRSIVVDGQQRLTTLSIALIAIRDHRAATEPKLREVMNDHYLVNRHSEDQGDNYYRLLPTQADRASYFNLIHGSDGGDADGQVGWTYRFFRQKLIEVEESEEAIGPAVIEQVVTSRLALVVIRTDRDDNTHRIFESLNNTGKPLRQADLLRNYLFMLLPNRSDHVYMRHWLPLQTLLKGEWLEQLMWLSLVLAGDDRVRQSDIYAAHQKKFEVKGSSEEQIETYVEELYRKAKIFKRIVDPESEPHPEIRAYLERLIRWKGATAYPAVLLLLDRQERDGVPPNEVVLALSYIESFLIRRALCQVNTNNLNRVFQSLPGQLPVDMPIAEGIRHVLSGERRYWPDDEDLAEAIRTKPFYHHLTGPQRSLILERLEESYGHPERVDFARAGLTIEHVMPQRPGPEWLEELKKDLVGDETAEDLHQRLVHTLGNLTLTAFNSELSNNPFQRKKELLAGSNLAMNRLIAKTSHWGLGEIETRAAELSRHASEVWPSPLRERPRIQRGRDWSQMYQALAALPHGSWTGYGDVAALIGTSPISVGTHLLSASGVLNAHRVLDSRGRVAKGFRWVGEDCGDIMDVLRSDGVVFNERGVADSAQRMSRADLASLLGLEVAEEEDIQAVPQGAQEEAEFRFRSQLAACATPDEVRALDTVFLHWVAIGGFLVYGKYELTSCALCLPHPKGIWPLVVYPYESGPSVEVVFQWLKLREPFVVEALREELRWRLSEIAGIDLPKAKLALRPKFDVSALVSDEAQEKMRGALDWFAATVHDALDAE